MVKVKDFQVNSGIKVTKICDQCGKQIPNQPYERIIKQRKKSNGVDYCQKCKLDITHKTRSSSDYRVRQVKYENSFEHWARQNNMSHLLEEFSENNTKKPSEISHGTNKEYLWNCPQCKSEYLLRIDSRTLRNAKCTYCSGRKINNTNNLKINYPEISKQWHPTMNGDLHPENFTYKSKKRIWWIGECGHEWDETISNRVRGLKCPYCSGKRVCLDNCLATNSPKIAKEWHPNKNITLTPYDVTNKSGKEVWWLGNCGHEFKMSVVKRTHLNYGCSICSEPKGERRIREWLEDKNIKLESQKGFDGLIGTGGGLLSYDFYLPEQNMLIEYQGEFHDGTGRNYFTKENLAKQQEHDRRKREYAEKKNIDLLEIWYWDYENIENILEKINYIK